MSIILTLSGAGRDQVVHEATLRQCHFRLSESSMTRFAMASR